MKKNLLFNKNGKYSKLLFALILVVFSISNSTAQNKQVTGTILAGDTRGSMPG